MSKVFNLIGGCAFLPCIEPYSRGVMEPEHTLVCDVCYCVNNV